jgi:uncharacterized membrane protein
MATESEDRQWRDEQNWRGCVYSAPEDPRVFVPKRIPAFGWTLNFGQPASRRMLTAVVLTYGAIAAAIAAAFMAAKWLSH